MTEKTLKVTFLGVGNATQEGLGHASAVIEFEEKTLLIDCGPGTIARFEGKYQRLPEALFITHCHLDHIADFENFFIKSWFTPQTIKPVVYVPVSLIPLLQKRVASYPNVLAEGGVNFWEAFQLVPVEESFYWNGLRLNVVEVRHHAPKFAYGLHLQGAFLFTGDTRPIPELINTMSNELIFHDCGVVANPSHTGIDDLEREYRQEQIQNMVFYHYHSVSDLNAFKARKLRTASPLEAFTFTL